MDLKALIAAKKAQQEAIDADLFVLTEEPTDSQARPVLRSSLLLLCILVNISAHRSNLFAADNAKLRVLAEWLGPYPSDYLPYLEPIPQLSKSYAVWQLGKVTGIAPAKLWPLCNEAILVCEKKILDREKSLC